MILRHLPNLLTIIRLILITPFLLCLYHQDYKDAFYIFMVAGCTDGLDGFLARYFHWQSAFGKISDPVSDKLLIASSFIALAFMNILPWWLVSLVFMRDFTISIGALLWCYALRCPMNFVPTFFSKVNTVFQLTLVTLCLFELAFFTINPLLRTALIYVTAFTTLSTYIDYVWTWGRKAFFVKHSRL